MRLTLPPIVGVEVHGMTQVEIIITLILIPPHTIIAGILFGILINALILFLISDYLRKSLHN